MSFQVWGNMWTISEAWKPHQDHIDRGKQELGRPPVPHSSQPQPPGEGVLLRAPPADVHATQYHAISPLYIYPAGAWEGCTKLWPNLCQSLSQPANPTLFPTGFRRTVFQPSPAQLVHPSLGVGLAKALPKAFSYRIWPVSSRPAAAFPCFEGGSGLPKRAAQSPQPSPG